MSKKTNGNDFIGILMLIFFMVAVPSFLIKEVTKPEEKTAAVSEAKKTYGADSSTAEESGAEKTYAFTSPVVDEAGIFSQEKKESLNQFLVNLNDEKGVQIGVLAVSSMNGEDIESFSLRHAEKWALGQKGVDNGALLVVSLKEHAVRIETGYGTEGVLTDAKCARILRNVIVPAFKSGDYEKGITEGVQNMAAIILEDDSMISSVGVKSEEKQSSNGSIPLPVLIFVIIWLLMLSGAMLSSVRRRRNGIFFVPFTGGFGNDHDHFGSGGFGGGSGFSGGGGSFGGGGASSGW